MNMLVRLDTSTLEATQQLLRDYNFSLSNLEKWSIAQATLLLHQHKLVELDAIQDGISKKDKLILNDAINAGCEALGIELQSKLDGADPDVTFNLTTMRFGDDYHAELIASFSGGGDGIDIKPLARLTEQDGEIIGLTISGVKTLFIDSPTAHSLEGYGSMYEEVLEVFEDWLPSDLVRASFQDISAYYEKHRSQFESLIDEYGFYVDFDEIVFDYISKNETVPQWYSKLNNTDSSNDPFAIIKQLQSLVVNVQHPQVKAFVETAIASFNAFMSHFGAKEKWDVFRESTDCCRDQLETEDPYLELGYILCWGEEGYWWDVVSTVHQMMMEAGEVPTHFLRVSCADNRQNFPLVYERFARGAILLNQLAQLSNEISAEHFKVA